MNAAAVPSRRWREKCIGTPIGARRTYANGFMDTGRTQMGKR